MEDSAKTVTKQKSKDPRFKPGQSGNPAGRPKGSRHKASIIAEQLIDGQCEELVQRCISLALSGDTAMLKLCLDRLLPTKKSSPIKLKVPPIKNLTDLPKVTEVLGKAVFAGEIDPDSAERISRIVERHIKAIEIADIEERLSKLEEANR